MTGHYGKLDVHRDNGSNGIQEDDVYYILVHQALFYRRIKFPSIVMKQVNVLQPKQDSGRQGL